MFILKKITNAGSNVPEPVRLSLNDIADIPAARPVRLWNGSLNQVTISSSFLPTHMTMQRVNGKEALCYEITPNMIFEATVASSPASMKIGTEYSLTLDGDAITSDKTEDIGTKGATLIDKNGATKAGDRVLISFR